MKVLQVIPTLRRSDGGPSHALVRIADGLRSAGISIDIATTISKRDDPTDHLPVPAGIDVKNFPRQLEYYSVSLPLRRWLRSSVTDYDLVHVHALFSYPSVAAAKASSRTGVPYVIRPLGTLSHHGLKENHPWLKQIALRGWERRALQGAAMLHYTTQLESREARGLDLSPPTTVIPVGIDLEVPQVEVALRDRYPQLQDRIVVAFMSRIHPKKGLDLLLDALARARTRAPELALVIAGSGASSNETEIDHHIERAGLGEDIVRIGFVAGPDKTALLEGADLFALPSKQENFGVAVAEAMLHGLPVVVTPQVALADEIAIASAGLVVDRNVRALSDAIEHLARDQETRHRLGANGKRLVRERYSLDACVAQTLTMYERVLADGRSSVSAR